MRSCPGAEIERHPAGGADAATQRGQESQRIIRMINDQNWKDG